MSSPKFAYTNWDVQILIASEAPKTANPALTSGCPVGDNIATSSSTECYNCYCFWRP